MAKKALITGITGQDGSYLAEHLLSMGYEVYGLIRRNSVTEHQQSRLEHIADSVQNEYGDVLDVASIDRVLSKVKPDEVYNLAAQSHVRISFDIPQFTVQANALGAMNVLESVRTHCPEARFYQASSSEMFGNSVDIDGKQREDTRMTPVSPYGCAKLFAYSMVRNYRNAYKLFASNGILFNHESPRRASNFVTTKIVKNAILISRGKVKQLELGNLDSQRDWGHSKDYVKAMHLILNHDRSDDFVVSTGETRSIRDLCEIVFRKLGLDYRDYVVQNPKYMRPEELSYLCGDSTKIRTTLHWKPDYSFEMLIDDMLDSFQGLV
ncbi:GDP-mannose 4,6-dehydratase [Rhodoferax aquaticus]|uniref:GDP-mannose 4,6-dehydratase n=1 Tax=Rhodoferax aquaticus TaxID=2527691 RepID=A0A515ETR7_9BURK|nr:GDP-mannose 4,6-dehydratase [Rhodoferax aquaticus]QDL56075.1 GDP-mannose 4,6-dehydratase [Rhodoferax aquaticus]